MRAGFAEIEVFTAPTADEPHVAATETETAVISGTFDVVHQEPTNSAGSTVDEGITLGDPAVSDGWEFSIDLDDIALDPSAVGDGWKDGLFLLGSSGQDVLTGDLNNDVIIGGGDNDYLYGLKGDDTLVGQDGDDHLDGGQGADWLIGDAGKDVLLGREGDDKLEGGTGDDHLDGGSGIDVMIGGEGRDTFAVKANSHWDDDHDDWYIDRPDTITDFEVSRDRIDVSQLFDNFTRREVNSSGSEAFREGWIHLVQHGNPGEEGFGTKVCFDLNGAADGGFRVAVADLLGVAAHQLDAYNFTFTT